MGPKRMECLERTFSIFKNMYKKYDPYLSTKKKGECVFDCCL